MLALRFTDSLPINMQRELGRGLEPGIEFWIVIIRALLFRNFWPVDDEYILEKFGQRIGIRYMGSDFNDISAAFLCVPSVTMIHSYLPRK